MLGAVLSLYDGSLLSIRVNGRCGQSQSPSIGLRQGCPLTATLSGIFIDALHNHLQSAGPAAEIQVRHVKLTELVYADDICLMVSSSGHPQALIDALIVYCATSHMTINVATTKVMMVSKPSARLPAPVATVFICTGILVEHVESQVLTTAALPI